MNVPTGQCCPPSIGMVAAFQLESLAGIVGIRTLNGGKIAAIATAHKRIDGWMRRQRRKACASNPPDSSR